MFGKIEGQRLILAKMYMANYCLALRDQAGTVDVDYVISRLNSEYGLVPENLTQALIDDVLGFYEALDNQQITSIDRGSYWKWRTMNALDAKKDLERELQALAI